MLARRYVLNLEDMLADAGHQLDQEFGADALTYDSITAAYNKALSGYDPEIENALMLERFQADCDRRLKEEQANAGKPIPLHQIWVPSPEGPVEIPRIEE